MPSPEIGVPRPVPVVTLEAAARHLVPGAKVTTKKDDVRVRVGSQMLILRQVRNSKGYRIRIVPDYPGWIIPLLLCGLLPYIIVVLVLSDAAKPLRAHVHAHLAQALAAVEAQALMPPAT